MKYFLKETYAKANHAGPKARMDAEKIMLDSGYLEYFLKGSQKNNNLNQNNNNNSKNNFGILPKTGLTSGVLSLIVGVLVLLGTLLIARRRN